MKNDTKIEIYEYKELELFGSEIESRKKISPIIAAQELLDKYEIDYFEIEESDFNLEGKTPSLKIKISIKMEYQTDYSYPIYAKSCTENLIVEFNTLTTGRAILSDVFASELSEWKPHTSSMWKVISKKEAFSYIETSTVSK